MLIANTLRVSKRSICLSEDLTQSGIKYLIQQNPFSLNAPITEDELKRRQDTKRAIKILSLFNNDRRGDMAPFSIQNVAEVGLRDYAVYPGEWYGINTASHIFQTLLK